MFWKALGAAAIAYALLLVLLVIFQSRLVYLPNVAGRELVANPSNLGLTYESTDLETSDGETLHSWWVPAPEGRGTVLFSHGNAGNISHRLDSILVFHSLGLNVLIYDYRGYGESTGSPGEEGTYRDVEAAWNHLVDDRGLEPSSIVLFGRSLGGAVSAWLAKQESAGALILESTFTSIPALGQEIYWWLPVRWLSRLEYDTRTMLGEIDVPVMIIHGPEDEIIPFSHGQALFEAAGEPKTMLEIRGGHNTGFLQDRDRYLEGLDAFLSEHL